MNRVFFGDCRDTMRALIAQGVKVQMCVTSPPYFGLRDYGVSPVHWPAMQYIPLAGTPPVDVPAWDGALGLEPDPMMFVGHIVAVFRAVREVLADDGTCWVNFGDSFCNTDKWGGGGGNTGKQTVSDDGTVPSWAVRKKKPKVDGVKPKDMMGIPWRVAFALQADGWYLRQDIIWHKPNPMPESVTDRCTKAHEYLFLLAKRERYFFDHIAIQEPETMKPQQRLTPRKANPNAKVHGMPAYRQAEGGTGGGMRNKRSVWSVNTAPYSGAHFATFPPALIEPCILAGSRAGDVVLDPFFGSGTTGQVAQHLGRQWIGCELNPDYAPLQRERTRQGGLCV